MIQLFLALTLTGLRPQFSAMTSCSTGRICTVLVPGTLGAPEDSRATQSYLMLSVPTTYRVVSSMIYLLLALSFTGPQAQFLAIPSCSRNGICAALVRGTSGGHVESPATLYHQMPSVGATYRCFCRLALRLISHPSSIIGHVRMFSETGLPEHFGGTWEIFSNPCLRNTVRFQDLPGASVDDTAAFGFKAVRPPSSILGHARMLSGTAFSRHGSC